MRSLRVERTRYHDGDTGARLGWWRRLTLRHGDDVFLDRWGIDVRLFGVYVHRIAAPDPGLDLHDHPWPFVSLVLCGGYTEEVADTRKTALFALLADVIDGAGRGHRRSWRAGSVHRIRLTEAHRIIAARPHTWTLVVRGVKSRQWGFYPPSGWVSQLEYDYTSRRPCSEARA